MDGELDTNGNTGIFDQLKAQNNNIELSDKLKDNFLRYIDAKKDEQDFYLDAFNNRVTFNGIKNLPKGDIKLDLNKYQINEIHVCANNYQYFRRNYCKIVSKSGIERPNPRQYQVELENVLVSGKDSVVLYPRQSGKTVTVSMYLLWVILFNNNKNIGIAANVQKLATEVLDKIKKIYIELPVWLQAGIIVWNKQSIEFSNGVKVMTSATNGDSFRGFSIHTLYVDEAAFIKTTMYHAFADSVFPSQDALAEKQTIISSTPKGMNHFHHIVNGARNHFNGFTLCEASWREVPRWNKDKTVKDPELFKKEQIAKNGKLYWAQNFECDFIDSSNTLIDKEALRSLNPIDDNEVIYDTIFKGLRIIEEPQVGGHYIITVDPKVDGADLVGIQVIDVTEIPFKQVAAANLRESYMLIPSRIFDLGNYYNKGLVVIENNMDKNIADSLFQLYEYEGEVFQEEGKRILGFRTTVKSKKTALSFLKKFIEEGLLLVQDYQTIAELFTFVEQSNGKFKADDGSHDDLVMSLMLVFAPFLNTNNWDDFKGFVTYLDNKKERVEQEEQDFEEFLDLGFADVGYTDNNKGFTEDIWL